MTDATMPQQPQVFEEQEQYQAPPEVLHVSEEEMKKKKKRKRMFKLIGGGFGVFVVLLILLALIVSRGPENLVPEPTPTPLPTQAPSTLDEEVQRLKGIVDDADPAQAPFAPPPVDMEVKF